MTTLDKATVEATVTSFLARVNPTLTRGLGNRNAMCTWAAINLALTGRLDDECPACACPVLHRFTLAVQDIMPREVRNSEDWRRLIPRLAGSRLNDEVSYHRTERIATWLWEQLLPELSPVMARFGCEKEWNRVLKDRDVYSCIDAFHALNARKTQTTVLEGHPYMEARRAVSLTRELLSLAGAHLGRVRVWNSVNLVASVLHRVWKSVSASNRCEAELFWDRIAIFPLIEELLEMQA